LLKCNEIISYCSINSSKTNDGIRNATNGLKTDLSADYKVYKKEWTGSSTFVIDDINAKISRLD
jgi:hypothetical protein